MDKALETQLRNIQAKTGKAIEETQRLEALKPDAMCQYRVYLTDSSQVDDELIGWIRTAYDRAGP